MYATIRKQKRGLFILWVKLPLKFAVVKSVCKSCDGRILDTPCTLGEEIVSAIHVDHTIFQDAFPLIFYTGNLDPRDEING
jgi:hypothetical protein